MREKGTYQWPILQVLVLHYSQGDALISAVCFRWKTRNLVDVLQARRALLHAQSLQRSSITLYRSRCERTLNELRIGWIC